MVETALENVAPDVRPARQDPSERTAVCGAIAATGLPGTLFHLDLAGLDDDEWGQLLRLAESEHLTGVLLAGLNGQMAELQDSRRENLIASHRRSMTVVLLLERAMMRAVDTLASGGIEVRVLKGSAVARLDYPNPSQRAFGDVDLMVRPEYFDAAVTALTAAGYERSGESISRLYDRRFGKGATMVAHDGTQVDLHRTFVMGRFGLTVDLDEAWAGPEPFVVAGTTLQALSAEGRLLHAAYHAVLGGWPPRFVPYRDVAEMVLYGRWDDVRLRRMCRHWRADAVLATAVREAWELLGLEDSTALSTWAQQYAVRARDRRVIALHRSADSSYSARQLAALGALPWRHRWSFARALVLPSRQFLRSRGTTLPAHITHSLRRGLGR